MYGNDKTHSIMVKRGDETVQVSHQIHSIPEFKIGDIILYSLIPSSTTSSNADSEKCI